MKPSEKNGCETNSFEENRKQYVEMVWTRIRNGGNRWPKRIMTWSPGGRRRQGRPEVKCEKEGDRVMKQRNLTGDEARTGNCGD